MSIMKIVIVCISEKSKEYYPNIFTLKFQFM